MIPASRMIKLFAFINATGHHLAAWRHPEVPTNPGHTFEHYKRIAQIAEGAKLDAVFAADVLAFNFPGERIEESAYGSRSGHFEPITLMAALSSVTSRIGLVCTASSTYNEPFHVARKFASLDHLSSGRAGWNLVTSANSSEAANFGRVHPSHEARYERAEEFIDVVRALWDSWADDAFVRDKQSGRQFEPSGLRRIPDFGSVFSVRGPLNIARPPQGHPVCVQAGSSEAGRRLAARTADVVFTVQERIEDAKAFYTKIKAQLSLNNRDSSELLVLPGLLPVVAKTQAEAEDKLEFLQRLIHPAAGMAFLSSLLGGADLSGCDPDGYLPEIPSTEGGRSRRALVLDCARREGLTIRQLYTRFAGARGHLQVVGTPTGVADAIEEWVDGGAADGLNVMPASLPGGLEDFADLVVPELRRRGRFRTEYEGVTLRQSLGLRRPATAAG